MVWTDVPPVPSGVLVPLLGVLGGIGDLDEDVWEEWDILGLGGETN